MIDYEVDAAGIATIAWNMQDRPMNVLNDTSLARFGELAGKAIADAAVVGVIVTSRKKDFIAGADLTQLLDFGTAEALTGKIAALHQLFRRIERCGKPFVASINGTALGGGYELCLVCHRRIAADDPRLRIGLPEVTLGLLPGGGGTQRLARLIGAKAALPLLVEGATLPPAEALDKGLVDAVVPLAALDATARSWILAAAPADAVQPWDVPGFTPPGSAGRKPARDDTFVYGNALLEKRTMGNFLAPRNIMSCVYEGLAVDIDAGLRTETHYFVQCATHPQSANLIRTMFFNVGRARKLEARPSGVAELPIRRIGVLGAGMMGSGVAHVAAAAGLYVVLLDTSAELADRGKARSRTLLAEDLRKGRTTAEKVDAVLARIHPTTRHADLAGCDLVIEAVFEDRAVKADATRLALAATGADLVFASNTSTLPITGLAEASTRPDRFIGLHFFSPVDRMPLIEVILGKATSQETLAHAFDLVRILRKTPIVVNDSRGFFTSRVFATYVNEGLALLEEGVAPALIENAGRMAGMPVGPLALSDEVSIELAYHVQEQTRRDLGAAYVEKSSDRVNRLMVEKLGRLGRKARSGYYDYPADSPKRLWRGLSEHFPLLPRQPDVAEVIDRLLFIQSVEALRCIEENVVMNPADADIGSILGWGFPAYHGGVVSFAHAMGLARFRERSAGLAQQHGARFAPPALLERMLAEGRSFYTS